MDIVAAVELLAFSMGSVELYLDTVVVKVVFLAEDGVDFCQNALLLAVLIVGDVYMAGKAELVIVQGPYVHVVHLGYALHATQALCNFSDVQVRWHCLEDEDDALPEGQPCGPQDDDSENVGADRVHVP